MFEAIALIIVGALLIVSGVFNMKGNLKIIHSYHYKRVKEEDKLAFGKLVGIGSMIIGVALIIAGILMAIKFFTAVLVLETIAEAVSVVGLVLGITLCFYAMFKYNKGIF